MPAQVLQLPDRNLDRAQLIKALLRKFLEVTADRRVPPSDRKRKRAPRTRIERADRAVRAEVKALEHLIAAVSQSEVVANQDEAPESPDGPDGTGPLYVVGDSGV